MPPPTALVLRDSYWLATGAYTGASVVLGDPRLMDTSASFMFACSAQLVKLSMCPRHTQIHNTSTARYTNGHRHGDAFNSTYA